MNSIYSKIFIPETNIANPLKGRIIVDDRGQKTLRS